MIVIVNSCAILENVKDIQVDAYKGGALLCATNMDDANEYENILKKFKIQYSRFGNSKQFEINCNSFSAYNDIIK